MLLLGILVFIHWICYAIIITFQVSYETFIVLVYHNSKLILGRICSKERRSFNICLAQ